MSSSPESTSPQPVSNEVLEAFVRIIAIDHQIESLEAEKQERLEDIRAKIRGLVLPKDAKIAAAALLTASNKPLFDVRDRYEYLSSLDAKVKANRGGVVVWTSFEEMTSIYRDPVGPNETTITHYLNLGVLPNDASLQVHEPGWITIPVARHISQTITHLRTGFGRKKIASWKDLWIDGPVTAHGESSIAVLGPGENLEDDIYIGEQDVERLIALQDKINRRAIKAALTKLKRLESKV